MDEEALALPFPATTRKRYGLYFTPGPLVDWTLREAARWIPPGRPLAIADPACGPGAFLCRAAELYPHASLHGLELCSELAQVCRARVPKAAIIEGDAFKGGFEAICRTIPPTAHVLWVGNPPYNGKSAILEDKAAYRVLRGLMGGDARLPAGQSLRDDYAFFLLLVARALMERPGTSAMVTSATFIDGYLYAPLRRWLLDRVTLRKVVELGRDVFSGAQVRTCVSFWTGGTSAAAAVHQAHQARKGFDSSTLNTEVTFEPASPEWRLRPPDSRAEALDAGWRATGEALSALVPVSLPGLKTRFDELLVDDDPDRLLRRIEDLAASSADAMEALAARHQIPARCLPKLNALKRGLPPDFSPSSDAVRPFVRYKGAAHRTCIPRAAFAYCYLDRRLIPRGDHRLRGPYDPHRAQVKLVFNARELPLSAALLEEEACIHAHRHSRFAPLWVPRRIHASGLGAARAGAPLDDLVPNLSPRALAHAAAIGGPLELFRRLVDFINSDPVQSVWAPAFGSARELPVPIDQL